MSAGPAVLPTVMPVVGVVVGYAGTLLTEARRDRRAAAREAKVRELTRTERLSDDRQDFELRNLLETHDALRDLGRIRIESDLREPGVLFDEIDRAGVEANARMHRARSFILDDQIRALVEAAHSADTLASLARPNAPHKAGLNTAALNASMAAFDAIGERVRSLYGPPVITV